ncbi:hypothetical protein FQN57_000060 [Myotisia sp. PD_48]|nr:hypothetical protein FQN57_000060 [Myotisia sp. PD_48]
MDPHHHTSGRWLHQDQHQLKARDINFNFQALCERVIKLSSSASKVTHCEKIEGGFNRSFLVTLDNGSKLVARLPTSVAGPKKLTTNSEVATMDFLRSETSIPIPKVLEWNDDQLNPIGADWDSMDSLQRATCTQTLSKMVKQLAAIDFSAYGSLYSNNVPLSDNLKIPFSDEYCMGPQCAPHYWKSGAGEAELYGTDIPDCEPWRDLQAFCEGQSATGYSRLPRAYTKGRPVYLGSIDELVLLVPI